MDELERELRRTLGRVDPPPGFEERVLRRTRVAVMPPRRTRAIFWVPAAAAALLLTVGVSEYRERQRGAAAKDELMLALRVTGSKLHAVRNTLQEVR